MRTDLLEAQASVAWAVSQLPDLAKRLDAWLERGVTTELRDPGAHATHNLIIGVEKELLPLSFNVEVGAYINVIRSSLDILAMALVRRHNLSIEEDKVFFPIANSESRYASAKWTGRKFINALPANERAIIESLKPYQGGSHEIWALHQLDILRKHRRLLYCFLKPISISIRQGGTLAPGDFEPLAWHAVHVNDEMSIGMLRKGVDAKLVLSKFYVGLDEQEHMKGPVVGALGHLTRVASGIIAQFG
jgi:hypothetical protein